MDVKVSSKKDGERTTKFGFEPGKARRQTNSGRSQEEGRRIERPVDGSVDNILVGEKIPLDVVNPETGEIIIPANRKITKTLLRSWRRFMTH